MAGPPLQQIPFHLAMPNSQGQELMTDWTPTLGSFSGSIRREKSNIMDRSNRPPYHHSQHSQDFSYPQGQTLIINSPAPPYHLPYPSMSGSHLQPIAAHPHRHQASPLNQSHVYYPTSNGEYEIYSNSWQSPSPGFYQNSVAQHSMPPQFHPGDCEVSPLLTTNALSRPYEYEAAANEEMSRKRRGKQPLKSGDGVGKALRTPKRMRSEEHLRPTKRFRQDTSGQEYMSMTLTTAPESVRSLPVPNDGMTPIDEAPEISAQYDGKGDMEASRRPLVITRHHEEGRKLGLLGIARGELEEAKTSEKLNLSPRLTTIDVIETDESGKASITTKEVLETETRWFEDREKVTPPSSPTVHQLQTPVALQSKKSESQDDEEEEETPEARAQKITRRLQSFFDSFIRADDQPLVSTRIDLFGRVAVRKSTASSFLQLTGSESAIEETNTGEGEAWSELPEESGSFKISIKPMWPDDEAPWAFAGGMMKDRLRREEGERAHLLRRYLEAPSDESDDEDFEPVYPNPVRGRWGPGRGKSVVKLLPEGARERRRRGDDGSARAALLGALRSRPVPILPPGVVACECGENRGGSMVACAACRTWHHLLCNGIDDITKVGPNWWCTSCNASASGLRTPVRSHATPQRSYSSHGDPRSSAVKSDIDHIALAPSPMFASGNFSNARTPLARATGSPQSRPHRSRMLSYGSDVWAFQDDAAPPSTPVPVVDRYSTPRINDTPFDVTSTPSRHLDFNFGQPSLFSLTPLGGRSRVPSTMLVDGTPVLRTIARNTSNPHGPLEAMSVPSRADFFRELNKGNAPHSAGPTLGHHAGPSGAADRENPLSASSPRWPHSSLLGAHPLSPSPFGGGHRRTLSGNKMSSMRSSSRSGFGSMGMGVAEDKEEEE